MVFGSITFLFYFLPVFLLLYYLVPSKWQNLVLLVGSLVFYAYGAPRFLAIFIVMIFFNWLLTRQMHISPTLKRKKWLLAASITLNLLVLGYFKYMNFFIENLNVLLQLTNHNIITFNKIALPIGISFSKIPERQKTIPYIDRYAAITDTDVVMVMFTTMYAYDYMFGFVETALKTFEEGDIFAGGQYAEDRIQRNILRIKNSPEWLQKVENEAIEKHISLDENLRNHAQYVYEMDFRER